MIESSTRAIAQRSRSASRENSNHGSGLTILILSIQPKRRIQSRKQNRGYRQSPRVQQVRNNLTRARLVYSIWAFTTEINEAINSHEMQADIDWATRVSHPRPQSKARQAAVAATQPRGPTPNGVCGAERPQLWDWVGRLPNLRGVEIGPAKSQSCCCYQRCRCCS